MERTAYLTQTNADQKAAEYLALYAHPRRRAAELFRLEGAALLVLDMQAYFLAAESHAHIPSAATILPRLQPLIQSFQRAGRPVFYTRHLNTPGDAGNMGRWWRELLAETHPLSAISPPLAPEPAQIVIKTQYDSFYQSELAARLANTGASQLIIGGVMTHLCCETTARAAFVRGWEVFFLVDGTATYNERLHTASLLNLGHGFATLAACEELCS